MSKIVEWILNIFRFHKGKIAVFGGFYLIMMYFLFPFNDLGDLVSSKISEQTQVFVDFDNINLSIIPRPGLSLSRVTIETPFSQDLTAKSLTVSPSLLGLVSFRPGVVLDASGFLGGQLELSAGSGDKTQTTPSRRKKKISLDMDSISIASLARLASAPLKFEGRISGSVDAQFDTEFAEQPTATVDLKADKTVIPEGNINTPMGAQGLPKTNLGEVTLQGTADKGNFEITRFVAGKPGGDFYASGSGRMDVRFYKGGPPSFGAYDLNLKIQVGDAFKQKLGSFLGVLQGCQISPNSYSCRISASNTMGFPAISKSTVQ